MQRNAESSSLLSKLAVKGPQQSHYANYGNLHAICKDQSFFEHPSYTLIIAGWFSNSNYFLLGGLRAVAQTISYEVSLALILLSFIFLVCYRML